ncbi:MAG: cytochrome c3 family protein [Elusimicrobiota bacterium]
MIITLVLLFLFGGFLPLQAAQADFGARLFGKFQAKACTQCHDFFETNPPGLLAASHKGRSPRTCVTCHTSKVTGFTHADDWFARPGLYTSAMSSTTVCETIKNDMHAQFKNESLSAREMEKHLLEDPRVLWAIESATSNSGRLPGGKTETGLVAGGLAQWKKDVREWIKGGMSCQ